ncbi:hypothetical protein [Dyella japonica]|uniref:Uncharacterized protein n=1 Tax=Dyella japonica TaxID=231455 RepID=A0ABV2K291_9GAMM
MPQLFSVAAYLPKLLDMRLHSNVVVLMELHVGEAVAFFFDVSLTSITGPTSFRAVDSTQHLLSETRFEEDNGWSARGEARHAAPVEVLSVVHPALGRANIQIIFVNRVADICHSANPAGLDRG